MPGPWISAATDPDGWDSIALTEGDYVEFQAYDSSHCRQGNVLARIDKLSDRTKDGLWAEATFVAVSDEHLQWWLDKGDGRNDAWQFEIHFCRSSQRACRQSRRGRGRDFHTDRFRLLTYGDLTGKKVDWLKTSPSKKYVEEELQRLANLPTGKDKGGNGAAGAGLGFGEALLPQPDPSEGDEALKGLADLEKEIGQGKPGRRKGAEKCKGLPPKGEAADREDTEVKKKKKKKRKRDEAAAAQGRAQSAPARAGRGEWFGQPARDPEEIKSSSSVTSRSTTSDDKKKKKKKKKKKAKTKTAKDRGPFGVGAKLDYGTVSPESGESSDDSQLFREGPSSGGTSLQLQLQEYALKRPGRLASRLLQKMQVMVAKEGGPMTTAARGSRTPPVATNWMLTLMMTKQPVMRLAREMRTLAMALDEIAAGRYQYAADVIAQRLKALELFQNDGSWNRAQYLELLDAEGPSLLGRDEAVMASKEWAGELRMRKLQSKGGGKAEQRGDPKGPDKGDPKGGKDSKKGKPGKGKGAKAEAGEEQERATAFLGPLAELGNFAREYANPIHPGLVVEGLEGITTANLHWVRFIVLCLDFVYCAGWSRPVCVPMGATLYQNQKVAIKRVASQVDRLIARSERLLSSSQALKKLRSKTFDYNGHPVDHMQDLSFSKVIKAWPRQGTAAVVDLKDCLPEELQEALDHPEDYLLPEAELPERHRGSRVRASEEEWFKIVKSGYDRGMFVAVSDSDVPVDKRGHLITNGAGGVAKVKHEGGQVIEAQRFISILCPTNDSMRLLPGAQDQLPYIGQLTAILADKDSYLVLDSEDLQSAFNLFRMPLQWAPFFSFAQKVRGDALGGSRHEKLRPALRVVPMGWTSAVTLVQAAIRHIAYKIAKIPPHGDVTMDQALPLSSSMTVLYLDNFDEIRHLKKEIAVEESGQPSPNHVKFIEACEALGLPRNQAKQLSGALSGTLQGGEILGREKIIRHAYERTVELISLGLALLSQQTLPEHGLRHWAGKAAFAAAFRRPLYSVLQEVYGALEVPRGGADLTLPLPVIDEVMLFTGLLPLAETDLSSELSGEISCTDASPTGGGSSVATSFKDKALILPDPVEDLNFCGNCHKELSEPVECAPFGVREPTKRRAQGDQWDFRTDEGKERLEEAELDGDLMWSHWSPTRVSFSKWRGQGHWDHNGRWDYGLPRLRDREHPEGLPRLRQHENVTVRQANAIAKRALRGLVEAKRRGRFASLEHPYDSFLWDLPEARALYGEGWHWSVFSCCCFGGTKERWLGMLHNSASVHAVLNQPTCTCVQKRPQVGFEEDEGEDEEYPWHLCLTMAEGARLYTEPFGARPLSLDGLIKHQLQGATRGLQQQAAVDWAVHQCLTFLETMDTGQEKEHLAWLLRHTYHTGCDVRLTDRGGDVTGNRPGPYPAFRWHWRDVLSYRWKEEQHINVLEMTAFLTELRRRARNADELGKRFFCIIDSRVSFYVLGKGRSSSKRLNRVSRRIATCGPSANEIFPMVRQGNTSRNDHLRFLGITAKTRRSYETAVAAFFAYVRALRGRLPATMQALDDELSEYINHLYQEGDTLTQAGWTVSGLKRFYPRCRPHLLTSQVFLRNWQRVHLPKRTTPMTWLGAKAMAAAALQVGRPDLSLIIFLGFAFFLRTMEVLALQSSHVRLFPEDGTVIIAIVSSKTSRGLQQSLSLREPGLVAVLQFLFDRARPSGPLYQFSVAAFRREFSSLVKAIGLEPSEYLPYSLRRGGAIEFYQRTQSLGRTMVQGRWKDSQTARIYIDDARATLVRLLLPPPTTARQTSLASLWRVATPAG
ncbi:unnamed protein product [Symbiodinium sp. CCMP2592]|nr:unnamed protein product [Symbiodinium sp. CCMP2592]